MDLGYRGGEQVLLGTQAEMSLAGYAERLVATGHRAGRGADRRAARGRSVALGSFVPFSVTGYTRSTVAIPCVAQDPGSVDRVLVNAVSTGYFDLMGIPSVEGRGWLAPIPRTSPWSW